MTGLSRREFLTRVAALASVTGLNALALGAKLAAAPVLPELSTLTQTIRQSARANRSYRTLVAGPGEDFIPRLDVLRRVPEAARTESRRSLLYLGHLSDLHLIDPQSPARLEPMIVQSHSTWAGAFHPQDSMSVHVNAATVKSFSDLRYSPVTGAPMGAAVVTGDSADMISHLELRWYIDILDGLEVDPNSGAPGRYEGVQAWPEAEWAYRPGDPAGGSFGDYGFPRLPNLLNQAMNQKVQSVGLPVPWYVVYGNHDKLLFGSFHVSSQLDSLATGDQKSYSMLATASSALSGYAATNSAFQRMIDTLSIQSGRRSGFREVTADPDRHLFEQHAFMAEHFQTQPDPGPVGHGFTQHNLDTGETWWKADFSPRVRGFGLDTCNDVAGPDGAVPDDQFQWLERELEIAQAEQRLCLIFSHHNSLTLENRAVRPGRSVKLHGADELIALLLKYPVVVGWLNGHTHLNQILAHTSEKGGFWEITTASCIDFPQQQQVLDIVDNRDGTLSLFTMVVDHAGPPQPGSSGSYLDLASQSRELAANDWAENPMMRRGSPLDRNTELLLPAPFDLSVITDRQLESQHLSERTRLELHTGRQAG